VGLAVSPKGRGPLVTGDLDGIVVAGNVGGLVGLAGELVSSSGNWVGEEVNVEGEGSCVGRN